MTAVGAYRSLLLPALLVMVYRAAQAQTVAPARGGGGGGGPPPWTPR